ncbi:MAG TPA: hypothetical protein VGV67_07530, partial [Solirubrobacteraceae bacterium]|nr:hypothetical protein [Solirubrobacteraceae bacterium]
GPALSSQAPAQVPTLTNDVGQRGGGAERQLPLGIALLTLGLLGLVFGVAKMRPTPRASQPHAALRPRTS